MARRAADTALGEPRWAISLIFAAIATAAVCYPVWPGLMSFDSLFAYRQARTGIETMLWPPFHSYMFRVGDALGVGVGGVLAAQVFVLFAAAAVILNLLIRGRALGLAACMVFAGLIVTVTPLLGSLLAHWRDVPTASFALLGVAFGLLARRTGQPLLLAPAAAAFGCAIALRYNAIVLVAPVIGLMIWRPMADRTARFARPFALACLILALGAAWASTQWRLPDLKRMDPPNSLGGTQAFDLVGISACADTDDLPLGMTGGTPLSAYHIRRNYDPRHMNLTFEPKPGVPPIIDNDRKGEVPAAWRTAIATAPLCYLSHRTTVFVEQMGMSDRGVFYPVHGGIDTNDYGLSLAHPTAAQAVRTYVEAGAAPIWRRPAWLYVLAAGLVGLAVLRDGRQWRLLLALLGGSFAYAGVLFLVSPAADARYIFPASITCALLIAAALGMIVQGRRG